MFEELDLKIADPGKTPHVGPTFTGMTLCRPCTQAKPGDDK